MGDKITPIKRFDEMDYYEILNVEKTASQEEIESAYLAGIATYHPDSLASYSLISEVERRLIIKKIEEAFQILGNSEKRRMYDLEINNTVKFYPKAYFRKSTKKLEIEDGEVKKNIWQKLKSLFSRKRKMDVQKKPAESYSINTGVPNLLRGEYLKKVREIRGLRLDDVASEIKMNISQLKALEEEDYESLPKGINISSLIKTYAHYLGFIHQDKQSIESKKDPLH